MLKAEDIYSGNVKFPYTRLPTDCIISCYSTPNLVDERISSVSTMLMADDAGWLYLLRIDEADVHLSTRSRLPCSPSLIKELSNMGDGDILLCFGDMGDGGLFLLNEDRVEKARDLPSWAPIADATTVNLNMSSRECITLCSQRGESGSIVVPRIGIRSDIISEVEGFAG